MALEGVEAARVRAHLLEFLKFRVLAAQDQFFTALDSEHEPEGRALALRQWLKAVNFRQAQDLSDADLLATLETARYLYGP
jgi:hypothetical protein